MHFIVWDNFPLGGFNDCAGDILFRRGAPCKCVCTRRYLNPCIYISSLLYIFYTISSPFLVDLLARAVFSVASRICSVNYKLVHHWRQLCMLSGDTVTKVRHTTSDTHRSRRERESERGEDRERGERDAARRTQTFGPSQVPPVLV